MKIHAMLAKNKKAVIFTLLLSFLVASYILVSYMESKTTFSNEEKIEDMVKNMEICLGGEAIGIKILSTGVLVMENEGNSNIMIGDIILEVNNTPIDSNNGLISEIQKSNGKLVNLKINRNGELKNIQVAPNYSVVNNMYELGIWVKDSSAGVGTISFYDKKNNLFAALGHGITETSNNIILPINSGAIVRTKITEINKGKIKKPGDIKGILYTNVLGQITNNTHNGIYGFLEEDMTKDKTLIEIATKTDIVEGPAKIYCTLSNKIEEFDVNIERILYNSSGNKNMVIKIVDKNLINKTGGIIQGMSGSPIVQNGKLIGAVTHVFYNDPTQGYGVFIENMISDIQKLK